MVTASLSLEQIEASTVRFYNDGPEFPTTELLKVAERGYRAAYLRGAQAAAKWTEPDEDAIEDAWEERRDARRKAQVYVPSAILFGDPSMESEQILYRPAHEPRASQARGRCQALEVARQCWDAFTDSGVPGSFVREKILVPWLAKVEKWSAEPVTDRLVTPPMPEDRLDEDTQKALDHYRAMAKQIGPPKSTAPSATYRSIRQLLIEFPDLRSPVIHGLLRSGETMNVISAPKIGKSWLVTDLALAVATGRPWLDTFQTERGDVLIIDNELHGETSAHRIPKVAAARAIPLGEIADHVFVENLRGRLQDIFAMNPYFDRIAPGQFKVIVLDAAYRFMPRDVDENDNGTMANIYNHLDAIAARLGCSFVLIHHTSKGNQAGKAVTDVGAGAGSQSRATDTHLILRLHEQDDCVVLDAAVRSWPPLRPRVLRWTFPVWTPDDALDPAALRPERPRRKAKAEPEGEPWDGERFVAEFVGDGPLGRQTILDAAAKVGLSERKAATLLRRAQTDGHVFRWAGGDGRAALFATRPQLNQPTDPSTDLSNLSKHDAVVALLRAEPALSNRQAARRCGVSYELVRKVRGDLPAKAG